MTTNKNPTPKVTAFSLTDQEVEIIKSVSVERRLFNLSAALRQIVNEWKATRKAQDAPDYNGEGHA